MLKAICSRKELTVNSYYGCIDDLIGCDQLEKLKEITHHIHTTRFQHCVNVSYYSYLVCRRLRLNARSAARAGLLHDLFYYDWHDGDWSHRPHGYRHPGFAVKNARVLNPAISKKEENIILRHMFPLTVIPPRYAEGWVVSLCDKYCATRELLIADHIRFRNKFEEKKGELLYFKELLSNA